MDLPRANSIERQLPEVTCGIYRVVQIIGRR